MAKRTQLPAIAGSLTVLAAVVGASVHPDVRKFLLQFVSSSYNSTLLKALAVVIALVNFKNIPGIWHLRVFRGIIYHLKFQPNSQPPKHLFAPLVTSSYNTLYDSDYNIHKSNSTYFADLDVARAHHLSCIIRTGVQRMNDGDVEGLEQVGGRDRSSLGYGIALGAVGCFFHRQIEPMQGFDIYTRVLSWDRKWLYVVSHIVKKGAIKPDSYVLQPWKSRKNAAARKKDEEDLSKYIFASSVARYVFKKGRLTINPEIVLERSRLLPPRPAGVGYPPRSEASIAPTPATPATPAVNESLSSPESIVTALDSKLGTINNKTDPVAEDDWTWDDLEKERLRGLELAQHFDALSGLQTELKASTVLGQYGDYW